MPSDIFETVFDAGCGTCMHTCECGKTHFDGSSDSGWTWEEGELEELEDRAGIDANCMEHSEGIGYITIDGRDFVYGCDCNGADRYEKFLLSHAPKLAKYINLLAEKKRKELDSIKINELSQ